MPNTTTTIGEPINRVDGILKVTGRATYAAEPTFDGLVHGLLVCSTIASGTVKSLDTSAAKAMPGVMTIITSENMPKLKQPSGDMFSGGGLPGEKRLPLSDDKIHYAGQAIAVVVADTIEHARDAARHVKAAYDAGKPLAELSDPNAKSIKPAKGMGGPLQQKRGDIDKALAGADLITVKQIYSTPTQTHNPMELSATVAAWDGDKLTVWDATQYIYGVRATLADMFGVARENVRSLCPFVGGGFGCKGAQWPHTILTAAAAKVVGKPVKLMLTRQQMFTSTGHRPELKQTITMAAAKDGKIAGVRHESVMQGSSVAEYAEESGATTTRVMYTAPSIEFSHEIRMLDIAPPTFMRAPGETPGTFAVESAMDEMAAALNVDPVEFRLTNHADIDPSNGKPWSSKNLKECYQSAADRFGWAKRDLKPRSMKSSDGKLIGWGMATALYPANRWPASARIRLLSDGGNVRAVGASATHDLGTGAYTVFTQITAGVVGLPVERVKFELGDSTLPVAPVAGGSNSTASVGQALTDAAVALKVKLLKLCGDGSPLAGMTHDQVDLRDQKVVAKSDPAKSESIAAILKRANLPSIEATSDLPGNKGPMKLEKPEEGSAGFYTANSHKFTFQSFGCHFVEVMVDEPIGRARVTRVVSAMDIGRVINPKTARNQVMGGVTMGIGMALLEGTEYDTRTARPVTDNLADYAVCVNADIPELDVIFLDHPDMNFNALGCRGVGEIGITGVAAAVANAVYHATGKRIRELPITTDKLM